MNILSAAQAAAFEADNELDLYHYPSVFAQPLAPELSALVALAKGVFSSAFLHPDYGVESTVTKDRFLVFEHNGEVAVLVLRNGETALFMPEQPQQQREAWLWVYVKQYLRQFNPDNLAHIPSMPAAEKVKPVKRAKVKKSGSKAHGAKAPAPKRERGIAAKPAKSAA